MSKFSKIRSDQRKRSTSTGTTPVVKIIGNRRVYQTPNSPNRAPKQQPGGGQ